MLSGIGEWEAMELWSCFCYRALALDPKWPLAVGYHPVSISSSTTTTTVHYGVGVVLTLAASSIVLVWSLAGPLPGSFLVPHTPHSGDP